ncbi:MAG TPA: S53 family peptidase [Chloroflexota bacterium]|nr:S53 family peptidase [Chloroflexota bacterium]
MILGLLWACTVAPVSTAASTTPHPGPGSPIAVTLVLAPRDEQAALAAGAAVTNPRSPAYRRYFSPETWARRFGPNPSVVKPLIRWLTAKGIWTSPWRGGMILRATGLPSRLRLVFGATGDSVARLPARFLGVVRAVLGLNDPPLPSSAWRGAASIIPAGPAAYTIRQVTDAYDFAPLYAAGIHGEHMRTALVELAPYDAADVAAYAARMRYSLNLHDHQVDAGNAHAPANVEATVDIELLSAAAPGAVIDVWDAPHDSDGQGLIDAYGDVASDPTVNVLGLTWVTCEPTAAGIPGFLEAEHLLFAQMAAQGTTIVSATGDEGAYGCADPGQPANTVANTQPAVSVPASDPYVLAVGATDLSLKTSGAMSRISSETAWSCPAARHPGCAITSVRGAATGGGISRVYTRTTDDLTWQVGPGVHGRASTGGRQAPDVAASGSSGLGDAHGYAIFYRHAWTVGGGTSAAMPIWAALVALTDQYASLHRGSALGWVNPLIYHLAASPKPYPPFHDVIKGTNFLYTAGPGWDYTSGWGSPDAWNFARDAASLSARAP